jgi:hypothetical protein
LDEQWVNAWHEQGRVASVVANENRAAPKMIAAMEKRIALRFINL